MNDQINACPWVQQCLTLGTLLFEHPVLCILSSHTLGDNFIPKILIHSLNYGKYFSLQSFQLKNALFAAFHLKNALFSEKKLSFWSKFSNAYKDSAMVPVWNDLKLSPMSCFQLM